ncbi:ABC transporter substrate-binding protein [Spirochaetia bacterium]|nr:ABC transporter substrate-binding protein [Spirochaetia bacterium]
MYTARSRVCEIDFQIEKTHEGPCFICFGEAKVERPTWVFLFIDVRSHHASGKITFARNMRAEILEDFMKKLFGFILTVALVMGLGALVSCKKTSAHNKDTLVVSAGYALINGDYEPWSWDYGYEGIMFFHSALLKVNVDLVVENDLAKSYTISDDGLIYTFILRDDVKFSDGTPLTAADVVFTYKTAQGADGGVDLTMLKNAEVVDGGVRFTLNKVFSPFIRTTASLGIVPEHAYNDKYKLNPIGTGPFKMKQIDVDQQLIIEPNPYYYGKKSAFKQITLLKIDEQRALAAAKSGELDVVMVNPEYAREKIEGFHLETIKTSDNRGFNLPLVPEQKNAKGIVVGNNVTSDPAVRRALNIGVSRQEIINNALNGIGTPSWVRFEPLPWANMEPGLKDNQVEEAKKLLEDAGWKDTDGDGVREKNGIRCAFKITGRADDLQRYNLAVALAENAKKLGIEITAQVMNWGEAKAISRNVPTCIGTGSYSYYDVYTAFYSELGSVNQNPTNLANAAMYSNKTTDTYINAMLAARSDAEAIVQAKLAQYDGKTGPNVDMPYIWLANIDHCYFVRDGLSLGNQRIHPHGHGMPVVQNMNEWRYE